MYQSFLTIFFPYPSPRLHQNLQIVLPCFHFIRTVGTLVLNHIKWKNMCFYKLWILSGFAKFCENPVPLRLAGGCKEFLWSVIKWFPCSQASPPLGACHPLTLIVIVLLTIGYFELNNTAINIIWISETGQIMILP